MQEQDRHNTNITSFCRVTSSQSVINRFFSCPGSLIFISCRASRSASGSMVGSKLLFFLTENTGADTNEKPLKPLSTRWVVNLDLFFSWFHPSLRWTFSWKPTQVRWLFFYFLRYLSATSRGAPTRSTFTKKSDDWVERPQRGWMGWHFAFHLS